MGDVRSSQRLPKQAKRSADQAHTMVSISVFCSTQEFVNVAARIDFPVLSSPTVMRTASSTKTRGCSQQIYGNAWPVLC